MIQNTINIAIRFYPQFLDGLRITFLLSIYAVLLATALGAFITLCKMSKFRLLRYLVTAYIEVIRGTPLLLQLYIVFFGLPLAIGVTLDDFTSILIALALHHAAYVAEIIRAGIQAVDKGQTEAARSLGLNRVHTMTRIVLPQAVKNILPALLNQFIIAIKETSLASVLFVGDLMTHANILRGALFVAIEPLLIAGALYLTVTFTLSRLVGVYERRLAVSD